MSPESTFWKYNNTEPWCFECYGEPTRMELIRMLAQNQPHQWPRCWCGELHNSPRQFDKELEAWLKLD